MRKRETRCVERRKEREMARGNEGKRERRQLGARRWPGGRRSFGRNAAMKRQRERLFIGLVEGGERERKFLEGHLSQSHLRLLIFFFNIKMLKCHFYPSLKGLKTHFFPLNNNRFSQ